MPQFNITLKTPLLAAQFTPQDKAAGNKVLSPAAIEFLCMELNEVFNSILFPFEETKLVRINKLDVEIFLSLVQEQNMFTETPDNCFFTFKLISSGVTCKLTYRAKSALECELFTSRGYKQIVKYVLDFYALEFHEFLQKAHYRRKRLALITR